MQNQKDKYETVEIEVIKFNSEDVIITSGGEDPDPNEGPVI
jgi:hypothetical protein